MSAIPKPVRELDSAYMKWIRTKYCIFWVLRPDLAGFCSGPIEAHHVIPKGGGKVGSKVSDRRCVPVCHPDQFREYIDAEAAILWLNKEYDAQRPIRLPKPKVTLQPAVKLLLIRCDCGLTHRVPRPKATFSLTGVSYYCAKSKAEKLAAWNVNTRTLPERGKR